jgi:hypothetical protein
MRKKLNPAMMAEAGIVMNQARIIFFATPHRTADTLCPAPTPMILEETTCVVDTGPPNKAAPRMTVAEAVWQWGSHLHMSLFY